MRNTALVLTALVLVCAAGALVSAGPLNPPAGPIAPAYKTLTEVEPRTAINATNTPGDADSVFKIAQAGSYYLTGHLNGVPGKSVIEIATSSPVTIDLNGFDIQGNAGSLDGIRATSLLSGVTIRNGTIRASDDDGIDLSTVGSVSNILIEDLHVINSVQRGIRVDSAAIVRNCTVSGSGNGGIAITSGRVEGCVTTGNGAAGISAISHAVVTGCTSRNNANSGVSVGYGSVVDRCSVFLNDGPGVSASGGTTVTACSARDNHNSGIVASNSCTITGNTLVGNGLNTSHAGIELTGSDNRVEQNNCSTNFRGIRAAAGGNIIVRNSVSGSSFLNWDIAANNICGPILDRTLPATGAISGNSGVSGLGSTDANANFTY